MKSIRAGVLGLALLLGSGLPTQLWPMPSAQAQSRTDEDISIAVYEQAIPAVVTIATGRGNGSGSIIAANGLVITNEHVVRSARGGLVQVRTHDGTIHTGQVLAVDVRNDLALVQLQANQTFPTIELGDPDSIRVGQQVYAIGSPFGLSGTFTTGILSRIAPNGDLQTDAAINPGNSGGPLLNSQGQLIGINKAILSPGRGGNVGIGFATSVGMTRTFIAAAQSNPAPLVQSNPAPSVAQGSGHRLGVMVDPQTLLVESVSPGSVAAQHGIQAGDRLVGLNRQPLQSLDELLQYLDTRPDQALLSIGRGGSFYRVVVSF